MIDFIINNQEPIVGFVKCLDIYGRILGIMPIDIQLELRRNLFGVDCCFHGRPTFIKHRQYGLIYIIVNQNYLLLCTFDEPGDKPIGIENLAIEEDVLFRDDGLLFQLVENLFNLLVGLQLLEFHSVKPLENLSICEQEMTHCDEGVHDAYANVYRSIAMEYG